MSGLRRYRATVYAYDDAGAEGQIESRYTQLPAPDGDGNWWCARGQPSGQERTLAAQAQHDVDAVFEFDEYVPVTDNGLIVSDGVQYLVRAILPREIGRAAQRVTAQRTEDVLTLIGIPLMLLEGPAPIVITGTFGNPDPDTIQRAITNIGSQPLTLPTMDAPTYSGGASGWLTTAVITGTDPDFLVTLGVTMGDIGPGVYTANGFLRSPGAPPVAYQLQMVILAAPVIGLTPNALNFAAVTDDAPTAEQTITAADPGGATLLNLAVGNASEAFLSVAIDPDTGIITVSCDPTGVAPGNYPWTFDVTADNAATATAHGVFDVDPVAPTPQIGLTPSTLQFDGVSGGSVTGDQTMVVADPNAIPLLNVQVGTPTVPWLSASLVDDTITVHCDPALLPPGTVTGQFDVTADNAATVTVTITFDVDAAPSPVITLTPSALQLSGVSGGSNSDTKTSTVSGGAFVNLAVGNPSAAWLHASLLGATISVYGDPALLPAGNTSATFDVTADNAATVTMTVAFDVAAAPTPTLTLSPSNSAAATGVVGGPNPTTQVFTISTPVGTLATPVRGTVTYPTGDSGWLTATITGSGPTYTLTLSFNTSGKTAPTSTAQFTITSAGAIGSPLTFTVTLTLTTVPVPPPVGQYTAPLFDLPDYVTYNSATDEYAGDVLTAGGFFHPDGDPNSPTFSYGPTGTLNPGVAQVRPFATLAQLAALGPVCVRGDILELTANISTTSPLTIPKHLQDLLTNGWVLLRGNVPCAADEDELHPTAADFASCRTITYTGPPIYFARFAAAANKWHLRDLVFKNGSSQELYGLFKWGVEPDATTVAAQPVGLKMERCWIDGAWTNTNRFCARGAFLSGSYGYFRAVRCEGNAKNGSSDSQGVLILHSLGHIQWIGGKCEGASENIIIGGGQQALGNQVYGRDIWFDRPDLGKRAAWMSPGAGGSTAFKQVKCHYELKCGVRVLLSNPYFANNNGAGQHDIRIKVSPYSAAEAGYLQTRDVTIWNAYGTNGCGGAVEVSSGDSHAPLPSTALQVLRIQIHNSGFVNPRNNAYSDSSITIDNIKRHHVAGVSDPLHQLASLVMDHCGFSLNTQCVLFTPNPSLCAPGFRYNNNLNYSAVTYQHVASATGGGNDIVALNKYCGTPTGPGTWECKHNAGVHAAGAADFYQGLEASPYNNLCFTSAGTPGTGSPGSGPLGAELNSDYTVKSASALHHSASDSTIAAPKDRGPDWTRLARAMAAHS